MEFEGQYLSYEEYQALEGTLEEMPFNVLEFEARKEIDLITHRRLIGLDEIPQEVKLCVYHLINVIQSYQNDNNRNISSETVGSYSVSYANEIKSIVEGKNTELENIIIRDLYGLIVNGEHVIYSGV